MWRTSSAFVGIKSYSVPSVPLLREEKKPQPNIFNFSFLHIFSDLSRFFWYKAYIYQHNKKEKGRKAVRSLLGLCPQLIVIVFRAGVLFTELGSII